MSSAASALRLASLLILAAAPAITLSAQTAPDTAAPATSAPAAKLPALSLSECVSRAMLKNFDLKIETFNVQNAGEALKVADADFVPAFFATATHSNSQSYTTGVDSKQTSSRAGVTEKFGSGAVFNLSTSLDRSADNNPLSSKVYNPAYNADLSLSVSQPLLQGFGPVATKANLHRAAIGVTRAGLDYKASVLEVIYNVELGYTDLCYAREQLAVRHNSFELAQSVLREAKDRLSIGVGIELDVMQAEVGVANAQRNIVIAKKAVQDSEDALLALIGQFELDTKLGDVAFPSFDGKIPSLDLSYKLAQENQPNYLSAGQAIKQLQIDADSAKRNRLPTLDLDAAVGYNTLEGSSNRAYRELVGSEGNVWQVGLTFRLPWGLKAENARYRSALNSLNQGRARQQQIEQTLMVQVRNAVRSVQAGIETVEIATKTTLLSQRTYEKELAKYSQGTSTIRRVREAQDDLENARISELQAKVNLSSAISALHRLEGSSLAQYNIAMP